MPPVGFEPTISAGARPQTYALDRAAAPSIIRAIKWRMSYDRHVVWTREKGNSYSTQMQNLEGDYFEM